MNKTLSNLIGSSLVASVTSVSLLAGMQSASAVVLSFEISGNDCSGVFGQGFDNCQIDGSPSIIKFDGNLTTVTDINSAFPSIDGTEFAFSNTGNGNGTGTWTYTAGPNDPSIRYWVAKAGPGFNLFYDVDDATGCNIYTDCLSDANVVTTGDWITPSGGGGPRDLSHITFYDTGNNGTVPEPLTILGAGAAIGFGASFKRKLDQAQKKSNKKA